MRCWSFPSSEFLYQKYQKLPEGDLTKTRASIVCEPTLALCAGEIELGEYLLLGKGEEASGGRNRNSVVSDAMEALIGAIYLDGGFANAKEFVGRFILNDIEHKQLFYDSKTILQEMVQSRNEGELSYELLKEEGPDHNKSFEVCARIGGVEVGRGTGPDQEGGGADGRLQRDPEIKGKRKSRYVFKKH